jgi:hypothetical protein
MLSQQYDNIIERLLNTVVGDRCECSCGEPRDISWLTRWLNAMPNIRSKLLDEAEEYTNTLASSCKAFLQTGADFEYLRLFNIVLQEIKEYGRQ